MQIEPARVFRRIIPPDLNGDESQKLKPSENSKSFSVNDYKFTFKQYLSGSKSFSYRCSNRTLCKCSITIPIEENYTSEMEFLNTGLRNYSFVNDHSPACLTKVQQNHQILQEEEIEVSVIKSEKHVLEAFVRQNPLLEPKVVKVEMLKQHQRFNPLSAEKFFLKKFFVMLHSTTYQDCDIFLFFSLSTHFFFLNQRFLS